MLLLCLTRSRVMDYYDWRSFHFIAIDLYFHIYLFQTVTIEMHWPKQQKLLLFSSQYVYMQLICVATIQFHLLLSQERIVNHYSIFLNAVAK